MKSRLAAAALLVAVAASGCSFQNKYEREADKITKAVIANNLSDVKDDLSPQLRVTRVKVAALSDELNDQGKLESIKEAQCPPSEAAGVHCFIVKFEKSTYHETLAMDDQNKVTEWNAHMADAR